MISSLKNCVRKKEGGGPRQKVCMRMSELLKKGIRNFEQKMSYLKKQTG